MLNTKTLEKTRLIHSSALVLASCLAGCTGVLGFDESNGGNGDGTNPDGSSLSPDGDAPTGRVQLPGGLTLNGNPTHYRVVRLTHDQWENAVQDLFGLQEATGLSTGFIPDPPSGKFKNNEHNLFISNTLQLDYQRAADQVSELVASDTTILGRFGTAEDPGALIRNLGKQAYRRPLTADEEARFLELYSSGAEYYASGNAFSDGARVIVEAMLQSPHFLFRLELTPEGERLNGFELASKLAFMLRNTAPDEDLLQAAENGDLDDDDGLATVTTAILDEPATVATVLGFHTQLLGLDRYKSIAKDTTLFPTYTEAVNESVTEADRLYFRKMYEDGLGLSDILSSRVAFVDPVTAPFYGVEASGPGMTEVELDGSRPGFLTRLGFLAYNGTLRHPDPIHRGLDINARLLCVLVAPPPGVLPPLPNFEPGQTNRERVTAHTGEGVCGNCHNTIINPPGFALEDFDAMGQYRTVDNGKPVDTSSEYEFTDGLRSFGNINELVDLLVTNRQTHGCYTANLTEFALGRDISGGETELITQLLESSLNADGSTKDILKAIVQSPQFVVARGGTP